jgi:hypothetical protein
MEINFIKQYLNLGRRIRLFRARMSELLGLQWGCALNSENEKKEVVLGCDGLAIWAACLAQQGQHRLAPGGLRSSLPPLFLLVQAGQQQGSALLSAGRRQLVLECRRDGSSGLELGKGSRENIPWIELD